MTQTRLDLDSWARADTYRYFRSFAQPHFATTVRMDVTAMMTRKTSQELSVFRTVLWAIGQGVDQSPALRLRFDAEGVTQYENIVLSGPIDLPDGNFRYCYIPWQSDRAAFDANTADTITEARKSTDLDPTPPTGEAFFFSCLPWLDYTSLDNALAGPDDCVPRVSWGKITKSDHGYAAPMSLQVHHALVDGRDVGRFFTATQDALNSI